MDNRDYSNRELDAKFDGLHEKLDLILAQTTKTNGRVSTLENWKAYMTGALAVCGLVMLLVVYIFNTNTTSIKDELARHEAETAKLSKPNQ